MVSKLVWTPAKLKLLKKKIEVDGWEIIDCAEHFGLSRQRIDAVLKDYLPELVLFLERRRRDRREEREVDHQRKIRERYGRDTWQIKTAHERRCVEIFRRKRQNVSSGKWPWTIRFEDLEFPLRCPILGIKLDYRGIATKENSPSFDRINPKKGYVKGNVVICSWRANRIKNNGTATEHLKIYNYMISLGK